MHAGSDTFRLQTWEEGPVGKGQGGLASHRFCQAAGQDLSVRLHAAIPLDTEIVVTKTDDGTYAAHADDLLVLSGAPTHFEPNPTDPVSLDAARKAKAQTPLRPETHSALNCVSCGLNDDSMKVHPGPLPDGRYASDLTPPDWAIGEDGAVDPGIFWMALDCTAGVFVDNTPVDDEGTRAVVTAQYHAQVFRSRLEPGDYTIVAYEPASADGWDGRKRRASSAAFNAAGDLVAQANSLWIAVARP